MNGIPITRNTPESLNPILLILGVFLLLFGIIGNFVALMLGVFLIAGVFIWRWMINVSIYRRRIVEDALSLQKSVDESLDESISDVFEIPKRCPYCHVTILMQNLEWISDESFICTHCGQVINI